MSRWPPSLTSPSLVTSLTCSTGSICRSVATHSERHNTPLLTIKMMEWEFESEEGENLMKLDLIFITEWTEDIPQFNHICPVYRASPLACPFNSYFTFLLNSCYILCCLSCSYPRKWSTWPAMCGSRGNDVSGSWHVSGDCGGPWRAHTWTSGFWMPQRGLAGWGRKWCTTESSTSTTLTNNI